MPSSEKPSKSIPTATASPDTEQAGLQSSEYPSSEKLRDPIDLSDLLRATTNQILADTKTRLVDSHPARGRTEHQCAIDDDANFFDKRRQEKQASRDEDQRRLDAGEIAPEELAKENGAFSFPPGRLRVDISFPKRK